MTYDPVEAQRYLFVLPNIKKFSANLNVLVQPLDRDARNEHRIR